MTSMRPISMTFLLTAVHAAAALALAGCATPGVEVAPQADDFAFVEMQLQG